MTPHADVDGSTAPVTAVRYSRSALTRALIAAVLSLVATTQAAAQGPGPCDRHCTTICGRGVSMRWNDCYANGGLSNRSFSCDTNSGTETLVGSFVLAQNASAISGAEGSLSFVSSTSTIPAWWQVRNTGSCRLTSLSFLARDATLPAGSCENWSGLTSDVAGGIGDYSFPSANSARLRWATAVPPTGLRDLTADVEYSVFIIKINHAKSVGTGACAGCDVPMCIAFSGMTLTDNDSDPWNAIRLTGPANGSNSDVVTWQSGAVTAYVPGVAPYESCQFFHGFEPQEFTCANSTTRVRGSTWSEIKSLYR